MARVSPEQTKPRDHRSIFSTQNHCGRPGEFPPTRLEFYCTAFFVFLLLALAWLIHVVNFVICNFVLGSGTQSAASYDREPCGLVVHPETGRLWVWFPPMSDQRLIPTASVGSITQWFPAAAPLLPSAPSRDDGSNAETNFASLRMWQSLGF